MQVELVFSLSSQRCRPQIDARLQGLLTNKRILGRPSIYHALVDATPQFLMGMVDGLDIEDGFPQWFPGRSVLMKGIKVCHRNIQMKYSYFHVKNLTDFEIFMLHFLWHYLCNVIRVIWNGTINFYPLHRNVTVTLPFIIRIFLKEVDPIWHTTAQRLC